MTVGRRERLWGESVWTQQLLCHRSHLEVGTGGNPNTPPLIWLFLLRTLIKWVDTKNGKSIFTLFLLQHRSIFVSTMSEKECAELRRSSRRHFTITDKLKKKYKCWIKSLSREIGGNDAKDCLFDAKFYDWL